MNGEKLNLTLVSYSSQHSASYPATNAFDGSTSTQWRTVYNSTYPQEIVVELDDFYKLCGFRIYPHSSSFRVSYFKILVSSDGLNFHEVYSNTDACGSVTYFLEFEFSSAERAKYVKIEFTGANESRLYVYEFEVYGVLSGSDEPDEPSEPGFEPEHLTKYLLKSEDMLCTVIDNELVLLDQAELTAEVFHSHGFDELPNWSIISTLTNPEILYWQSADVEDELPTITATMTAMPYPQTIISQNYDMSDDTILGVECAYVTASSDVVFAISVDDGASWYMWTGSAWGTLTDATTGMTAETINAITTEQWAGLMTTGQFKVRMTLFDENSSFTSFVMDYIN